MDSQKRSVPTIENDTDCILIETIAKQPKLVADLNHSARTDVDERGYQTPVNKDVIGAALNCEVCFGEFDDGENKPTCLFPCGNFNCSAARSHEYCFKSILNFCFFFVGHTFCLSCINKLYDGVHGTVKCPKCTVKNQQQATNWTLVKYINEINSTPERVRFFENKYNDLASELQRQTMLNFDKELISLKKTRDQICAHIDSYKQQVELYQQSIFNILDERCKRIDQDRAKYNNDVVVGAVVSNTTTSLEIVKKKIKNEQQKLNCARQENKTLEFVTQSLFPEDQIKYSIGCIVETLELDELFGVYTPWAPLREPIYKRFALFNSKTNTWLYWNSEWGCMGLSGLKIANATVSSVSTGEVSIKSEAIWKFEKKDDDNSVSMTTLETNQSNLNVNVELFCLNNTKHVVIKRIRLSELSPQYYLNMSAVKNAHTIGSCFLEEKCPCINPDCLFELVLVPISYFIEE